MNDEQPPSDRPAEPSWWQSDGHLSDIALSALADGQTAILPMAAEAHLAECPSCQARSGELVFLVAVAEWATSRPQVAAARGRDAGRAAVVRRTASRPALAVARPRFPYLGLLVALGVAAVGAVPRAAGMTKAVSWLAVEWRDALDIAFRTSAVLIRRVADLLGPALGWAPFVGAAVLLLVGIAVARGLPRRKGDWA